MDFNAVTKKIGEIVIWYGKTPDASPDQLLDAHRKLVSYLWFFSEYVSNCQKDYNKQYFIRKISVGKAQRNLTKAGLAVNKAETEALLENEDAFLAETVAEGSAFHADLLLKQGNKVADSIRTRISYLKTERDEQN